MTSTTLPRSELAPGITGWQGGSGPSLVLIHGVGLNGDAWYAMLDALTHHFSVTVVDLPGHGESARLPGTPELADYTAKIASVLTEIDGQSVIMGHSMGALIAMDLAFEHSARVSAVIALNAIFKRSEDAARAVQSRADALENLPLPDPGPTLSRWFGTAPQGELQEAAHRCRDWLQGGDRAGYAAAYRVFAHVDGPAADALAVSKVAMLFITGQQEPNSTPEMSQAMARIAPFGQSHIIQGARHMMPLTHSGEIITLTMAFLGTQRGDV